MAQDIQNPQSMENTPQEKEKKVNLVKVGLPILVVQILIAYLLANYVIVPAFIDQAQATSYQEEEKAEADEDAEKEFGVIYQLEDLIVNPSHSDQFLLVNLAFEVKEDKDVEILTNRSVIVRDILIRILSGKTIEQLDGPDDKEALRQEIKDAVSTLLPKGHLFNVYFANYIIQ